MEVITEDCKYHPSCPHGPCLLFERYSSNGKKSGKQFFACSASRDRSVCPFFQWADDKMSDKKIAHWKTLIEDSKPQHTHKDCVQRLLQFAQLPLSDRKYCKTCSVLVLPDEAEHVNHDTLSNISDYDLLRPSTFISILGNKKAEAQYFFSDKTVSFVCQLLEKLQFNKFLLIGCPKIHEYLLQMKKENKFTIRSLFLDIDHRYMQFFTQNEFCHYNMFNNYFFGNESSKKTMEKFLHENTTDKVVILIDPPFGGLIDAISFTLSSINEAWKQINGKLDDHYLPLIWFFPYFLEPRIIKNIPSMKMMDYKVDYTNHKKFHGKGSSKGSPVRIFTNIPASSFILPENEGYKFCSICEQYISSENQHCIKCNSCTTKHGKTFKHCEICKKCVKDAYAHCDIHNQCSLPITNSNAANKCSCGKDGEGSNDERCHNCLGYGHRKNNCPSKWKQKNKKPKHQLK